MHGSINDSMVIYNGRVFEIREETVLRSEKGKCIIVAESVLIHQNCKIYGVVFICNRFVFLKDANILTNCYLQSYTYPLEIIRLSELELKNKIIESTINYKIVNMNEIHNDPVYIEWTNKKVEYPY